MDVTIYLEPYHQTFTLPRNFITATLRGSLFSDALEGDPDATLIPIPNPVITPAVMQFLVDYSNRKEPERHIPDLIKASAYLNLPWMMYYVDPLYDYITDKEDWNSLRNQDVLRKAIQEDRVWVVGYYLNKGVKPTPENFIEAIQAQSSDVFILLLTYAPNLPDLIQQNLLLWSVENGFKPGVDLLLSKGVPITRDLLHKAIQTDQTDILDSILKIVQKQNGTPFSIDPYNLIHELLLYAARYSRLKSVDYLLTLIPPSFDDNILLYEVLDKDPVNMDIVERIISDPRFVPEFGLEELLTLAAERNQTEILQRILQDPRTRVNRIILENAIEAAEESEDNLESLALLREALKRLPKLPRRR